MKNNAILMMMCLISLLTVKAFAEPNKSILDEGINEQKRYFDLIADDKAIQATIEYLPDRTQRFFEGDRKLKGYILYEANDLPIWYSSPVFIDEPSQVTLEKLPSMCFLMINESNSTGDSMDDTFIKKMEASSIYRYLECETDTFATFLIAVYEDSPLSLVTATIKLGENGYLQKTIPVIESDVDGTNVLSLYLRTAWDPDCFKAYKIEADNVDNYELLDQSQVSAIKKYNAPIWMVDALSILDKIHRSATDQ